MAGKPEKALREHGTPLVDIFETNQGVTLQFELPGIPKDKIDINVDADVLSLTTSADLAQGDRGEMVLREFAATNFAREFVLSRDLDRSSVKAAYNNGVLEVTVAKAEAGKPRKIDIVAN